MPYICDPERVSLPLTSAITSDALAGSERDNKGYAYPGSSGLRPSDTRATKNAPLSGCLPVVRTILSDKSDGALDAGGRPQESRPACRSRRGEAPEGSSLFRPGVEARSADDPGKEDAFKVSDPARASHILVSQSVRHPGGVAGSLAMADPRVFGAAPLDPRLWSEHPQGVPSAGGAVRRSPLRG